MEKNFNNNEVGRKFFEYQPSPWRNFFVTCAPYVEESKECLKERANELKEQVRTIIKSALDTFEKMNLVEAIQRLGIGYHFEKEIDEVLTSLHEVKIESNKLHEVALHFRLLRQHGFHVSADEFLKLKDDNEGFSANISEDVRGLLSLYNAASLRITGEDILQEASSFAKDRLKYLVHDLEYPLKNQVSRALKVPLPRMIKRLEARWYIDEYKEENPNGSILEFAILDFNIVQALHHEELRDVSLWWNELNVKENFPYSRDRIVEAFFWMTGVYFEPQFSRARIIATKTFILVTLLDDTYDIYGTLEELRLLNDAIQRWDSSCAEMLPAEYLKNFYIKLMNFAEESEAVLEPTEKYRVSYLKELIKCISKACMQDAEWLAQNYTPTFKNRLEISIDFSFNNKFLCAILVGVGSSATKEEFEWVDRNPDPIRALAELGRLTDDIVTYEREQTVGQAATLVDCYMKEYNVTKEETIIRFNRWIEDNWRQVNKVLLKPTVVSSVVTERVYNASCTVDLIYTISPVMVSPNVPTSKNSSSCFMLNRYLSN